MQFRIGRETRVRAALRAEYGPSALHVEAPSHRPLCPGRIVAWAGDLSKAILLREFHAWECSAKRSPLVRRASRFLSPVTPTDQLMVGRTPAAISGTGARIANTSHLINVSHGDAVDPGPTDGHPAPQKSVHAVLVIAAFIATAAAATALWSFVLRDRFVPKRFGVVIPGKLFRSGQISRFMIADVVQRNAIGTIIDLNGLEPGTAD